MNIDQTRYIMLELLKIRSAHFCAPEIIPHLITSKRPNDTTASGVTILYVAYTTFKNHVENNQLEELKDLFNEKQAPPFYHIMSLLQKEKLEPWQEVFIAFIKDYENA
jgi:hypothetical protein